MNKKNYSSGLPRKSDLEDGLLIFVIADMTMFALFFLVFCLERSTNIALYQQSQSQLDQTLGMLNTLVLLVSSWFVVIATKAFKSNLHKTAALFMSMAFVCGCIFVVNKLIEYSAKISDGVTLLTNDFFMFYYILTGIHMLHVIGGMVVLLVFSINLSGERGGNLAHSTVEGGAAYWHMVDLLWIVIFPLIYLSI